MESEKQHLFGDRQLLELLRERNRSAAAEVDALSERKLSSGDLDDFARKLAQKYELEPIQIQEGGVEVADLGQAQIDVRYDSTRMIRDKSRPFMIPGTYVTLAIPFSGNSEILHCTPSQFSDNPPRGKVIGQEIHVTARAVKIDQKKLKEEFDWSLRIIQQYVHWGTEQVATFNNQLLKMVRGRLGERRDKFQCDRKAVEGLGFPVRERANPPQTYQVPVKRKKLPVVTTGAVGQLASDDPCIHAAAYESILQTLGSMCRVLELSPKAFAKMGEEALRFMLLVPLNIHYEGQATGETFNCDGKTDIIIKVGGRNIFIAECLIWDGPDYFTSKIDQLLGYTSWRDTKTAIVVFNRNKSLTAVLEQIPGLVKAHPNLKRDVPTYKNETGFRFVLHHRDDKDRELTLTVLVFDVPS